MLVSCPLPTAPSTPLPHLLQAHGSTGGGQAHGSTGGGQAHGSTGGGQAHGSTGGGQAHGSTGGGQAHGATGGGQAHGSQPSLLLLPNPSNAPPAPPKPAHLVPFVNHWGDTAERKPVPPHCCPLPARPAPPKPTHLASRSSMTGR
eukprot:350689-Chlamydomonas_euryale.AAC.9